MTGAFALILIIALCMLAHEYSKEYEKQEKQKKKQNGLETDDIWPGNPS
ncbi:hypothetical protein ACFYKX_10685 [Cytobacillus sp. FJAT-54145]|uniref:Phage protein n=1 Tax=Cytobacillus spartinae TaxID=3299023 RepID=A0ABW6KA16_9BACI